MSSISVDNAELIMAIAGPLIFMAVTDRAVTESPDTVEILAPKAFIEE